MNTRKKQELLKLIKQYKKTTKRTTSNGLILDEKLNYKKDIESWVLSKKTSYLLDLSGKVKDSSDTMHAILDTSPYKPGTYRLHIMNSGRANKQFDEQIEFDHFSDAVKYLKRDFGINVKISI